MSYNPKDLVDFPIGQMSAEREFTERNAAEVALSAYGDSCSLYVANAHWCHVPVGLYQYQRIGFNRYMKWLLSQMTYAQKIHVPFTLSMAFSDARRKEADEIWTFMGVFSGTGHVTLTCVENPYISNLYSMFCTLENIVTESKNNTNDGDIGEDNMVIEDTDVMCILHKRLQNIACKAIEKSGMTVSDWGLQTENGLRPHSSFFMVDTIQPLVRLRGINAICYDSFTGLWHTDTMATSNMLSHAELTFLQECTRGHGYAKDIFMDFYR